MWGEGCVEQLLLWCSLENALKVFTLEGLERLQRLQFVAARQLLLRNHAAHLHRAVVWLCGQPCVRQATGFNVRGRWRGRTGMVGSSYTATAKYNNNDAAHKYCTLRQR